ncbi:MAG: hypothetical protein ACI351_02170 [Candidatus Avelusimicrobium sp.]|uniref:hypothetical protein n=1 Tax=Candidatus Avelusimicrobium sp. TaxID=3048833 RepID=UPI003F091C42
MIYKARFKAAEAKNMKFSPLVKNILVLLLLCLLGGLFSLAEGQDSFWDLRNYHLYISFAFLNGRWGIDLMPAGIHTFLNPLLDVPYYLMVVYLNDYPKLTAFLQGLPFGVFCFAGYKTCLLFLEEKEGKIIALLATIVGMTGSMTLSQTGLSSNEVTLAALVVGAVYGVFRFFFRPNPTGKILFFSAFLAGATVGLKYTAAPFTLALTAVFLLNVFKTEKPIKNLTLFALGGMTGFLVTDGWFIWHLWKEYKNPLFPFFNHLFQSPFFENVNFDEIRFYPRSLLQWLFYPFFWIFPSTATTEIKMSDPRMALGLVSFFIVAVKLVFGKAVKDKQIWLSVLVFTATAYLLWLHFYATLRYAVPLELFSGILLLGALKSGLSYKHTVVAGVILAALIWQMTSIPNWGKTDFADKVIDLDGLPKLENNALVVYFGQEMSFLSPFFTPGTKFVGGITFPVEKYPTEYQKQAEQLNWFSQAYHQHKFKDDILRTISAHDGPIYIVSAYWPMMLDPITLAPYGLKADKKICLPVNLNNSHIWNVCKVQKLKTVSVPLT